MTNWHLGTVGFGYKDWDNCFYPAKTPSKEYLKYYSTIFDSVEIDSSFYGCPRVEQIKKWRDSTPEDFKFCVKTPRQITHDQHLMSCDREMQEFIDTVKHLEDKLGPTLIQMPPSFKYNERNRLEEFISKLPEDIQFAIEFRDHSWFNQETAKLLNEFNICWVSNDYLDLPKQVVTTSDFLYFRWIGRHGTFKVKDRVRIDQTERLEWWHQEIQSKAPSIEKVYGFFNNDFSGHSPETCNKLKEIIGLGIKKPQIMEQTSLF